MTDVHTKAQRSRNMSAIKDKNNKSTEQKVIYLFRAFSIKGWRRHLKNIPGKPDFTFPQKKVVVFVDGCFWHGCKKCYKRPKTNKKFWENKIKQNILRDHKVNNMLKRKQWKVIRLWEHAAKQKNVLNRWANRIKPLVA